MVVDQALALTEVFESTGMNDSQALHNWFRVDSYCEFTGVNCDAEGYVTTLRASDLLLRGPFPQGILKLDRLQHLHLDHNLLTGTLPVELPSGLKVMNLGYNGFEGPLSNVPQLLDLRNIRMEHNYLTGTIPSSLCHSGLLRTLDISSNFDIQGTIPSCFGELDLLINLQVHSTSLTGSIPSPLCEEREMNGLLPNMFGCDGIACAAGTFQKLGGRQWNNMTTCELCREPSNIIGTALCRMITTKPTPSPFSFEDWWSRAPSLSPSLSPSDVKTLSPSLAPESSIPTPYPQTGQSEIPSSLPETARPSFLLKTVRPTRASRTMQPTSGPTSGTSVAPSVLDSSVDTKTKSPVFLFPTFPPSQGPVLRASGVQVEATASSEVRRNSLVVAGLCSAGLAVVFLVLFIRKRRNHSIDNQSIDESELSSHSSCGVSNEEFLFTPSQLCPIEESTSATELVEPSEEGNTRKSILKSSCAINRSALAHMERKASQQVRFDVPLLDDDDDDSWVSEKQRQLKSLAHKSPTSDRTHWALWVIDRSCPGSESGSVFTNSPKFPDSLDTTLPKNYRTCAKAREDEMTASDMLLHWETASRQEEVNPGRLRSEPLLGITSRTTERYTTNMLYSERAPEFIREDESIYSARRLPSWDPSFESENNGLSDFCFPGGTISEDAYHDVEDYSTASSMAKNDKEVSLVEI